MYSRGKMNQDMLVVAICQEFKWDFYTYMSQPKYFIELIKEKLIRDQKEMEMKMRSLKNKRK